MDEIRDFTELYELKPQFTSKPWYNRSGDSLHFVFKNEEYYRERVDGRRQMKKRKGFVGVYSVMGEIVETEILAGEDLLERLKYCYPEQKEHVKNWMMVAKKNSRYKGNAWILICEGRVV